MTFLAVLTVFVVLESTLPSLRWSYKIQDKDATVMVLTVWRLCRGLSKGGGGVTEGGDFIPR